MRKGEPFFDRCLIWCLISEWNFIVHLAGGHALLVTSSWNGGRRYDDRHFLAGFIPICVRKSIPFPTIGESWRPLGRRRGASLRIKHEFNWVEKSSRFIGWSPFSVLLFISYLFKPFRLHYFSDIGIVFRYEGQSFWVEPSFLSKYRYFFFFQIVFWKESYQKSSRR